MSSGNLVFYSGVGLLVFTLLLALVFLIKKPRYTPDQKTDTDQGVQRTQKLRNGYPTGSVPLFREASETEVLLSESQTPPSETELLPQETELLLPEEGSGHFASATEVLLGAQTEKL